MKSLKSINKHLFILTFVLLTVSVFMVSCLKDDFNFNKLTKPIWEPNFSLPLVHSKLNLSKVLGVTGGDSLLNEDPNHFLTLIYRDNIYSQYADDVFMINDQNYLKNYNFSLPTTSSSITVSYTDSIVFNADNMILDSLYLKIGNLNSHLSSTIVNDALITIAMPTATKNGVPLSVVINQPYTGVPLNITYPTINLTGYKLAFNNTGGSNNWLPINYTVTLYNVVGSPANYNFNFSASFQNLKYSKMYGYLNQKAFLFPLDTLSIDIFKNSWFGHFLLEDPKFKVNVHNSFGFPLSLSFDLVEAINPKTPAAIMVSGIPNPFNITSPTTLGQVTQSSFELNKNNSNIAQAINITPHFFAYHFSGLANPTGIYQQNFILDTSSFKVDIEMDMPLYGRAWDFVLQDTVSFSFDKVDELVWANFKINILNGFPIDAKMQIIITDSLYAPLDSLFTGEQYVIKSGIVGPGPDYRVSSSTNQFTAVNLSQDRLVKLSKARKMLIRSKLNTYDTGANNIMKIYSDYILDVRMAVQAQLKVDLNSSKY